MRSISRAFVPLLVVLLFAGCASTSEPQSPTRIENSQYKKTKTSKKDCSEKGVDPYELEDSFREREQFFAAQQIPLGTDNITAVTNEQKQFIQQQKEHVQSIGGEWIPEAESLLLKLVLNACETSILYAHDLTVGDVQVHITSSPTFAQFEDPNDLAGTNARINGGLEVIVFGTGFICPDDTQQWQDAKDELFPES